MCSLLEVPRFSNLFSFTRLFALPKRKPHAQRLVFSTVNLQILIVVLDYFHGEEYCDSLPSRNTEAYSVIA
jgi:hypothetical protein